MTIQNFKMQTYTVCVLIYFVSEVTLDIVDLMKLKIVYLVANLYPNSLKYRIHIEKGLSSNLWVN